MSNDPRLQHLWQAIQTLPDEPIGEHLSYRDYALYLMDRLPAGEIKRVEEHLESCPVCTGRAARLATLLHVAEQLKQGFLLPRGTVALAAGARFDTHAASGEAWQDSQTPDGKLRWRVVREENGDIILRFGSHDLDLEGARLSVTAGHWHQELVLERKDSDQVGAEVHLTREERTRLPQDAELKSELVLDLAGFDYPSK